MQKQRELQRQASVPKAAARPSTLSVAPETQLGGRSQLASWAMLLLRMLHLHLRQATLCSCCKSCMLCKLQLFRRIEAEQLIAKQLNGILLNSRQFLCLQLQHSFSSAFD